MTRRDVPARDLGLRPHQRAIALERERLDRVALDEDARTGLLDLPDADAAVEARGRDLALVLREPRAIDVVVVAAQHLRRTVGDRPHARGAIVTGRQQAPAIARPLQRIDRVGVAAQLARPPAIEID